MRHPYNLRRLSGGNVGRSGGKSPLRALPHNNNSVGKGKGLVPLSYRIVTLQASAAIVAAVGLLLVSADEASAALLAGAVGVIPSGYLAWRAQVERSPGRLLGQGMAKFGLTLVLMTLAFAWFKPPPFGFFATLVLMQLMYIVGALGTAGKQAA